MYRKWPGKESRKWGHVMIKRGPVLTPAPNDAKEFPMFLELS